MSNTAAYKEGSPLVTIGLPVYNGEKYIALSIESLLAQDYSNFELLISDNCSTDRTGEICRQFASRDARVRYVRQPMNLGMPRNFGYVVHEARGAYFTWATHDDLFAPSYIRKCLAELLAQPTAVFCCSEINFIDGDGNPNEVWEKLNYKNIGTVGMTPAQRIHELLIRMGWFATFGVMRIEDAKKMSLGLNAYGHDVIWMSELMLVGDFAKVDEPLFSYRFVGEKSAEEYQASFNAATESIAAPKTPKTDLAANILKTVYQSQLSGDEKLEVFADFVVTLTRTNRAWRDYITAELLGSDSTTADNEFALLLATALSRSVPLDLMRANPLIKALIQSATNPSALLDVAEELSRPVAIATMTAEDAHKEGKKLFDGEKYEEASGYFALALQREETSERWQDWATARLACDQISEAANGFECAVALDSNNRDAALKLGLILANLNMKAEAIPYLARGAAGTLEPERSTVLQILADCHRSVAQTQTAGASL